MSRAASPNDSHRGVAISISLEISSPRMRSRSSAGALSRSSSKAPVRARLPGSRIWYSSSRPIVKSVDVAKRSSTWSR